MSKTLTTLTDIQDWANKNDMTPATIHDNQAGSDTSLLRFMNDTNDEGLHEINWEHFDELFQQNNLALVVEEDSKFNKFVSRANNT